MLASMSPGASAFLLGVSLCLLVVLIVRLLGEKMELKVMTSLRTHLAQRTILFLLLILAGWQGWLILTRDSKSAVQATERPAAESADGAIRAEDVSPGSAARAPEQKKRSESGTLRFILWLNLSLALPWITAHIVRWVLSQKSNSASFALLTGYVMLDVLLGMLVGRFSFAGGAGAMRLISLLALCAGYNYWAAETIAGMWVRAGSGSGGA